MMELTDDQIIRLSKPASFDAIAIAQEAVNMNLIVLRTNPDDIQFREKLQENLKDIIQVFKELERGNELIEVLKPLILELGLESLLIEPPI